MRRVIKPGHPVFCDELLLIFTLGDRTPAEHVSLGTGDLAINLELDPIKCSVSWSVVSVAS